MLSKKENILWNIKYWKKIYTGLKKNQIYLVIKLDNLKLVDQFEIDCSANLANLIQHERKVLSHICSVELSKLIRSVFNEMAF